MNAHDVRDLAKLARLRLDPDEAERLARDLSRVLESFRILTEIDVSGISDQEILHPHPETMTHPDRADAIRPGLAQDVVLRDAPDTRDGHLRTPGIFGGNR